MTALLAEYERLRAVEGNDAVEADRVRARITVLEREEALLVRHAPANPEESVVERRPAPKGARRVKG